MLGLGKLGIQGGLMLLRKEIKNNYDKPFETFTVLVQEIEPYFTLEINEEQFVRNDKKVSELIYSLFDEHLRDKTDIDVQGIYMEVDKNNIPKSYLIFEQEGIKKRELIK